MTAFTVAPISDEREIAALLDVLAAAFHFPRELGDEYAKRCGHENYRVVREGKRIVGGLLIYRMGQFFGGRSVPMAGIATVAIAPEARGGGAARALMCRTMEELHGEGRALSALYPATQTLYRRAGYEQAGGRYEVSLPLGSIDVRANDTALRPLAGSDEDAVHEVYRRCAARSSGNLDRCPPLWHRVRHRMGKDSVGFGVPGASGLEGYLYYVKSDRTSGPYDLIVRDLVAETPAAGRRLLALLAHDRSMAGRAIWYGHPHEPILALLAEQPFAMKLECLWMLRVVDVAAALTARGYPPGVEAELHFDVRDDVLAPNAGRYVLEVSGGRGVVRRGGSGTLALDVRGLATLYTGHRLPLDLIAAGHLETTPEAAKRAEAVFAGPAPWMSDMF